MNLALLRDEDFRTFVLKFININHLRIHRREENG